MIENSLLVTSAPSDVLQNIKFFLAITNCFTVLSAKLNGLKTELYIKYVIDNIGRKDINTLLPWSENVEKKFLI